MDDCSSEEAEKYDSNFKKKRCYKRLSNKLLKEFNNFY